MLFNGVGLVFPLTIFSCGKSGPPRRGGDESSALFLRIKIIHHLFYMLKNGVSDFGL
jgi:hypothetical protein